MIDGSSPPKERPDQGHVIIKKTWLLFSQTQFFGSIYNNMDPRITRYMRMFPYKTVYTIFLDTKSPLSPPLSFSGQSL